MTTAATTASKVQTKSLHIRSEARKKREATALRRLVEWAGSQAALADAAQVSRVAVNRWFAAGQVGKDSAHVLSFVRGCPVALGDMREDLRGYEFSRAQIKEARERAREGSDALRARRAAAKG